MRLPFLLHMNLRIAPGRGRPFFPIVSPIRQKRHNSSLSLLIRAHSYTHELTHRPRNVSGLEAGASSPKFEISISSDASKLAVGVATGLTVICQPAKADLSGAIQAGSNLVQKDTIIAVAFGTAILALGAVTIGVRLSYYILQKYMPSRCCCLQL